MGYFCTEYNFYKLENETDAENDYFLVIYELAMGPLTDVNYSGFLGTTKTDPYAKINYGKLTIYVPSGADIIDLAPMPRENEYKVNITINYNDFAPDSWITVTESVETYSSSLEFYNNSFVSGSNQYFKVQYDYIVEDTYTNSLNIQKGYILYSQLSSDTNYYIDAQTIVEFEVASGTSYEYAARSTTADAFEF